MLSICKQKNKLISCHKNNKIVNNIKKENVKKMKIITYCTKFFLLFAFAKALVRLPFILS